MDIQPYISIPSAPDAAISAGAVINAVVQEILQNNSYQLAAQSLILKLTIPLPLEVGDRVTLRVRSATPQEIIFDVPLPAPETSEEAPARTILERLDLPATKDNEALVREFVRMNAPIDRGLLAAAKADTPAKAEAAAFLAAHGVEPVQAVVDKIAKLSDPAPASPQPAQTGQPLLKPFVAEDPVAAIQSAPPESPLPEILGRSPRLRLLDQMITAVSETPPEPDPAPTPHAPVAPEVARRLTEAIRMADVLFERPPKEAEDAVQYLRPFLKLPAAALRELRSHLERMELAHLSKIPLLEEARQLRGTVFESFDRLMTHRLVNQLSALRDQGIGIYEMAVRVEGKTVSVPVRIVKREGQGRGSGPRPSTVTLDVDLTRLGRVRASLDSVGRTLSVRFNVRDADVRDHLMRHAPELADALRGLGLEPTVGAEVAPVKPESPLAAFAAGSPYLSLDLRA